MPLVYRITADMFEFTDVCSMTVNPVNLIGVPGAGLALEFRKRVPTYVDEYRLACKKQDLRVGTVLLIKDTGEPWDMLLFPTKRHYADTSSIEDIIRGLQALRKLLQKDEFRYASVGMPMLGCGLGKQDYATVQPQMEEYLSDLDATVFLSMAPDKTELRPKYLTIVGPPTFGTTPQEQQTIDSIVDKALELKMGMKLEDYTGVCSGGYPGVDSYIGGTHYRKDWEQSFVGRRTGKPALVVKPNSVRYGISANLHQGNLLGEIADDIILFKPKGHNNNRLSAIQIWLQANNEERARGGLEPRKIAIYGDTDTRMSQDDLMIPQLSDIPY